MIFLEQLYITDPRLNLATEEYLLRRLVDEEPILFLYVNEQAVIVGRNQNAFAEVNFDFVQREGIPVLRRLSGGGTVYHDPGNLNFSLITPDQRLLNNFQAYTRPVIDALARIGLRAELRNRSSIYVGDYKVSGNAQYASGGRLVSHGTLLLDSDLERLRQAIKPSHQQIHSRAVQSVRSRVTNLSDLIEPSFSFDTFKERVKQAFIGSQTMLSIELSQNDWTAIRRIAQERYGSWSWNIGRSPEFSTTRRVETRYGDIVMEILVENGYVKAVRLVDNDARFDTFLLSLSDCLTGVRYERGDILASLRRCDVDQRPSDLTDELLIDLII